MPHVPRTAPLLAALVLLPWPPLARPADTLYADSPPPRIGAAPPTRRAARPVRPAYAPIRETESEAADVAEIEMFVGESRVFPTPGVARIAVGNGSLLTAAALDDREVILFANGAGTSSLFVWNADGRHQRIKVHIVAGDVGRVAREVAAFLGAIPNARASVIGDKVIVEGEQLSDLDLAKIEVLAKTYPQIVNFTNRLGWEQMVLLDVKVVEFPVNELREIGLKWTAMGGAAVGGIWSPGHRGAVAPYQIGVPSGTNGLPITNADGSASGIPVPRALTLLSAVNAGLGAQLNLLLQNGHSTVLAEPQLSARNGAKASFLAGGEYPYTVSTVNGPTVLFKPYGVRLDIQPRVDASGVIRATVETEVSQIDPSVSTPAGPALLSRKTSTEFNVRDGQTLVLSGLIQREQAGQVDKVPLLGDLPVLGALFRSRRFQNKETELVVFVTPTVVDAHTPALAERVQRTGERLRSQLGPPPHLSEPLQPLP
ncbi:type II and III secretion system protein family protein [Hydrogenophaga sp. T2]|uniref:type II and III secretion system protein family protein n=1 Tax=Hydrogenophaga sp. T2 TaxID=3132823 RepID=UPI003CF9B120